MTGTVILEDPMTTKICISKTETSHPYTGPNGDRYSMFGFSVFHDGNLIGVVATNGRGRHKYRARLLAKGQCLASEGFATMNEAVQFIADQSAQALMELRDFNQIISG